MVGGGGRDAGHLVWARDAVRHRKRVWLLVAIAYRGRLPRADDPSAMGSNMAVEDGVLGQPVARCSWQPSGLGCGLDCSSQPVPGEWAVPHCRAGGHSLSSREHSKTIESMSPSGLKAVGIQKGRVE